MTLTTKGKSKTDQQSQIERANAKWLARSESQFARKPTKASQDSLSFHSKASGYSKSNLKVK